MATQTAVIMDTIAAMKRVVNRDSDRNDFDVEAPKPTNRGNKLKRRAELCHEGEMGGQRAYKKRIDHAGYQRYVVHTNPRRYDEHGYELDDEDEDEEADTEAAAKNPYSKITLENLLMPLTTASDLENHPTLSTPYKSKVLPSMVQQASNMIHKERRTLANLKYLLTELRGDQNWVPCGVFCADNDTALFDTDSLPYEALAIISDVDKASHVPINSSITPAIEVRNSVKQELGAPWHDIRRSLENEEVVVPDSNANNSHKLDTNRGEIEVTIESTIKDFADRAPQSNHDKLAETGTRDTDMTDTSKGSTAVLVSLAKTQDSNIQSAASNSRSVAAIGEPFPPPAPDETTSPSAIIDGTTNEATPPPRMLTRGQAHAQASATSATYQYHSRSISVSSSQTQHSIHPLFLAPPMAIPNRNYGLPEVEANETRVVLSALVQKQEEVVRGAEQLYEGLMKAERLARMVWKWSKAEGHIGEMSDGEDWVDIDEWGLDAPLKKGQEEVEDTSDKKTRGGRRTAQ